MGPLKNDKQSDREVQIEDKEVTTQKTGGNVSDLENSSLALPDQHNCTFFIKMRMGMRTVIN